MKKRGKALRRAGLIILLGWVLAFVPAEFSIVPCGSSPACAQLSRGQSAMQAKSKELQKKSHARTMAAIKRMHRILNEKRQGKYGFPADFNTVPGDPKRK